MSHEICLPWNINTPWNLFYHKTCVSLCNICRQNNAEKTSVSSHSILTVIGSGPCDLHIRASKAVICSTLKCVYLCVASAGKTTMKNISILPQPPYSDRRLTLWLTHQSVQGCNHGLGEVFCLLATGKVETIHLTIVAPLMEGWGGLVVLQPFQDGTVYHHLKQAQGCYTSCSSGTIQWDPKERGRLTWKLRTFCIFYYMLPVLEGCSFNVQVTEVLFLLQIWVSHHALAVLSLPMKRWKNRLACVTDLVKMQCPQFFLNFKHWFFFKTWFWWI